MAPERWTVVVTALVLATASIAGCKAKGSAPSAADAAPSEPAVEFAGRCINETAGTPYQSIYFFPKKNEMMFYLGTTGAFRVPINVTQTGPRKIDFTFRWAEKDEHPSTRTATVTAIGDKWEFELQDLKGSTCRPMPAPSYFKMLPELGIQAGKWRDPKVNFGLVVAADAQAWVLTKGGTNTVVHYRVLEQGDSGVLVAHYGTTPSDSDAEGWAVSRMIKRGDALVHELQDMKLNYKLVSPAPSVN